jgi:hypothetical protein
VPLKEQLGCSVERGLDVRWQLDMWPGHEEQLPALFYKAEVKLAEHVKLARVRRIERRECASHVSAVPHPLPQKSRQKIVREPVVR